MQSIRIEPTGVKEDGPCKCCGNHSRRVWGFIHSKDAVIGAYLVHWTLNRVPDHGANFDLILGEYGGETTAQNRSLVALAYRLFPSGPQFMVIDAQDRPA